MAGKFFEKSWIVCSTALLLTALLGFTVSSVRADAAPPPPPSGSDIYPSIGNTNVRMMSEYVVIDVDGASEYSSGGFAIITAQFFMKNLGETTEFMNVRFPMNFSEYSIEWELEHYDEQCDYISWFPSIDEINVWVDGDQTVTTITEKTVYDYMRTVSEDEIKYVHIKCWAHFDVVFPPDEIVEIKVSYKVPAAVRDPLSGTVEYVYVLQTGAGWKDTIGKADIVVRLPYDVNHLNFGACGVEGCNIVGKEITWHFEDFEPEDNIEFELIRPDIWELVVQELENIELNPIDSEAWGSLAKAYKEANKQRRGFLYRDAGEELFFLSKEAYEKSLELDPNDLGWRFGYADLLCWNAEWDNFRDTSRSESINTCIDATNYILIRDPESELVKDMVENSLLLSELYTKLITDSSTGNQIMATVPPSIASPIPANTESAAILPVSTQIQPTSSAPPAATHTPSNKAVVNTPIPALPQQKSSPKPLIVISFVMFGVIGIGAIVYNRYRQE